MGRGVGQGKGLEKGGQSEKGFEKGVSLLRSRRTWDVGRAHEQRRGRASAISIGTLNAELNVLKIVIL